jgi:PIN domain nuclease of toxin-antitoxin system
MPEIRDPVDRLIVAQAKSCESKLITRDRKIHSTYDQAMW